MRGQGSTEIWVDPSETAKTIVARVFLDDAPLNCSTKDVITTSRIGLNEKHVLRDEFTDNPNGDVKARLDPFASDLQSNPNLKGYILCYQGRNERKLIINTRLKLLKNYLKLQRGIDPSRTVIIKDGYREKLTCRLWLADKDVNENPPNFSSVDKKYVRYP